MALEAPQQRWWPCWLRPLARHKHWHCWLQPLARDNHGDHCVMETVANVLTSLPFVFLGLRTPRKKADCKLYGGSLVGLGVASGLYHASKGPARKIFRRGDYTMIATSALCLSKALLQEEKWNALFIGSACLLPFQPFLVAAFHVGLTKVTFARRVIKQPHLRTAHRLHIISSLAGGTLFIADDVFPKTPYLHAAWHLAAAVSLFTFNKLLD